MTANRKLSTLLDDPGVRELILGLGHVRSMPPVPRPGAHRLHAAVLRLARNTTTAQYLSWLDDDTANKAMTVEQVRTTVGDGALDDLARMSSGSPGAVAWQLAGVLPDLVDAVSPGGTVLDAERMAEEIEQASADDDRSAGAFGYRVH